MNTFWTAAAVVTSAEVLPVGTAPHWGRRSGAIAPSKKAGSSLTLHATTAAFPGGRTRVSVHGTQGGAEVEDDLLSRLNVDGANDDAPISAAAGASRGSRSRPPPTRSS
jgi:hypothetical protein